MATAKKLFWTGWVITALPSLLLVVSGLMKLQGGPEVVKGFQHLGIPASMLLPLAILELFCVVVYLIPATAVVGAILMTGYIGGAICTAWRAGDAVFMQIVLGLLVWLGLYLREERLKELIPLRKR